MGEAFGFGLTTYSTRFRVCGFRDSGYGNPGSYHSRVWGFGVRVSNFVPLLSCFFFSGEYPFDDLGSDFARDCPAKGLGLGIGLGVSSLSITLSVQGLVKSVIFWLRDQGFRSRVWGSEFGG